MRLLAAAVLAVVLLVSALFASVVTSGVAPTQPVPRGAGVVSAAALPTTPQLLGSVARQDVGIEALSVNATWRIVLAEDTDGFGWDIGNNVSHPDGDTGTYTFTQANERDYLNVTALLVNGIDDPMEFVSADKALGPANYSQANESFFFGTSPDFIGNVIDFIRVVIQDLHIYPAGTGWVEFANYTWQIWGHPIFVAFAPPSDADGTYLFDRDYTNVSVSLASAGTAVSLEWDGVNRSMQGAGRVWYLNVTNIPNGLHEYKVWANDSLNEVLHSEVRQLTIAFHYWSVQKFGAGSGPGLATDRAGKTHLCWEDSTGNVYYATNTSTGWSVQKIGFGGVGFCSIALDREGRPNVVFGALKYGILIGSTWALETIRSTVPTKGADIAINPVTDQPVVAVYEPAQFKHYLVLENRTGPGTWVASIVDRNGDTGWMPSLAVNSTGIAHMAYTDASGDLWYTTVSGGGWDANRIWKGPVLHGLGRISLALNSSGAPRIAYAGGGPRYGTVGNIGLRYASLNGTNWTDQKIYPGPIQAVSLVLDAQDHPHIAFNLVGTPPPVSGVLRDLRYLSWNGTWSVAVLSNSMNSTGVALALSPAGIPQIAATTWCCGTGSNQATLEYFTVTIGLFATFEVLPSMGNATKVFTFDPRASFDTYFALSALEARWDFNGDGVWDTGWGVPAVVQHQYSSDARYTAHLQLRDPSTVTSEAQAVVIVDSAPPVTTSAVAGAVGSSGWYVSSLNITLNATDDLTTVSSTSYRVDGGTWTPYSAPVAVSSNGDHTLQYYSVDAVGNTESTHTLPFRIDTGVPTTTASLSGTPGAAGWFVSSVEVTLSASDATSGVASTRYRIDGGSWQTYSTPFTLGDGTHAIQFSSVDAAGNAGAVGTVAAAVDTVAPTVTARSAGTAGAGVWFVSEPKITLTGADNTSGVSSVTYRIDGGSWQTYLSPFPVLDGLHTIEFRATDVAGNAAAVQSMLVKVDTTPPTVSGLGPTGTVSRSEVVLTWTGSDAVSGIRDYAMSVDGGSFSSVGNVTHATVHLSDGKHTIKVRAIDVAGNSAEAQVLLTVDTYFLSPQGPYGIWADLGLLVVLIVAGLLVVLLYWRRKRKRRES